jgi:hypothetical protein
VRIAAFAGPPNSGEAVSKHAGVDVSVVVTRTFRWVPRTAVNSSASVYAV